jgi:hypothetical protein
MKNVFALRERVVNSNRIGNHGVAIAVERGRKRQEEVILANLSQSRMVRFKWDQDQSVTLTHLTIFPSRSPFRTMGGYIDHSSFLEDWQTIQFQKGV